MDFEVTDTYRPPGLGRLRADVAQAGSSSQQDVGCHQENETPRHTNMKMVGIPLPKVFEDWVRTKILVKNSIVPWHEGKVRC